MADPKPMPGSDDEANADMSAALEDTDDTLEHRRKALTQALAEKTGDTQRGTAADSQGTASGIGNAFKLSSEFIAGILVGAGLGYLIDQLAGTTPWGMIVFLLLGFAAGVLNVLRAAGMVARPDVTGSNGAAPDKNGD